MIRNMIKIIIVTVLGILVLAGCGKTDSAQKKIEIGISQIVEYSALDENREGFLKALEDNGYKNGDNIEIEYQNAQGDLATAQTIAKNFVSKDKELIFAIATGSVQGSYNATKDIPILFSSVTDPVAAGVVESLEMPNTNVSGTSDYIPVEKQMDLIKKFVPNATNIGVIYNTSEVNSQVQVSKLKESADEYGYKIVEVGVTSTNEVNQAISSLTKDIDVLFVPTDQLVVSSMPVIVQQTMKKNIPIIASEKGSVELGALVTQGINYYDLGYKTGEMAVKVLNGEDISKMPVTMMDEMEIIVNEDSLKALGIDKPQDENIIYINTKE
ncbi:ABC transporter substrate-binding protein [Clostridiisalibacter paucivorans]|uniref:ABC transporter substrate-binding protein n=1 Tax=Clostridiisalibacter paucivorans TaxID=408753 RepID=UPI00047CA49F|nr:ABC transporter substrate-binding protein [Clostridiisalibacter paucivorans]